MAKGGRFGSLFVMEATLEQVDVIIPAYKPGEKYLKLIEMLQKQSYPVHKIIVMNTEEKYYEQLRFNQPRMKEYENLEIIHLSKREFDHGKTRNRGVKKSQASYFIMMTDDAIPTDEFLVEKLISALQDPQTAIAYARQVCSQDADLFEIYARSFNYPEDSLVKGKADIEKLGIKTFFCSNVCAAYKKEVFEQLGGFVNHTIFNEDMIYAAKAVEHDYKIAYVADARVEHFHRYTNKQQFQRNFDLAVSQADHPEVFEQVKSESEGIRFVKSQISYLKEHGMASRIPSFVIQCGCKLLGYKLGKKYKKLPKWLIRKCSMNKEYWH